jgi:hypothetical protein
MKRVIGIVAVGLLTALAGMTQAAAGERIRAGSLETVVRGTGEWWNVNGVKDPFVLTDDGIYKMWFTAIGTEPDTRTQIGYARSADGAVWTDLQMVHDTPGKYRETYGPWVLEESGEYVMYHTEYYIWMVGQWADYIARATSPDGIVWSNEQTVLTGTNIPGDWQGRSVSYPCVVRERDGYVMWYRASAGQPPWLPSVGCATSSDGVSWANCQQVLVDFPERVHVLPQGDGTYVMYTAEDGAIVRATSPDGSTWSPLEPLLELPGEGLRAPFCLEGLDGGRYLYFQSSAEGTIPAIRRAELETEVGIDIDPGHWPNTVCPGMGVIPVAILTSELLNATTVDPESVRFGPGAARALGGVARQEDVDGDGDVDVVLRFSAPAARIHLGDTTAELKGRVARGEALFGIDAIVTTAWCPGP